MFEFMLVVFVAFLLASVISEMRSKGANRKRTRRTPAHNHEFESLLGLVDNPEDEWIEWAIMDDLEDDW